MVYTFTDTETIVVKADLLDLCMRGDFIETAKRPTNYKNLFWWLECYPNTYESEYEAVVKVLFCTSVGGFEAECSITIDRSDIKCYDRFYYEGPVRCSFQSSLSHTKIRSGSIIQDGSFVIRCKINFKIDLDKLARTDIVNTEKSCIVKFDRKILETYKIGQRIVEKRTVDGITWWIQYFPCGEQEEMKGYVSVYFHIEGGPRKIHSSLGMSISGVFLQQYNYCVYREPGSWGNPFGLGHKQLQFADHVDDVINLVLKVKLDPSALALLENPTPLPIQIKPVNKIATSCVKDSATFTIMECQLELNAVGEFDSTPNKFAKGSDKHQWRLLYFPAGDLDRSKGHISLHIEASTTETQTVILSGVIRIDGSPFDRKFKMFVEEGKTLALPKLISHEELRRDGGIVDNQIRFICDASFET